MEYRIYQNKYLTPYVELETKKVDYSKSIFEIHSENNLVTEIFAPDPITGFPKSALNLLLNDKVAPEIQMFVKEQLCKTLPPRAGAPDDETALDTVVPITSQFGTELDSYYQGLSDIIKRYNDEFEESNKES